MKSRKPEDFFDVSIKTQDPGCPDRSGCHLKAMESNGLGSIGPRMETDCHGFKKGRRRKCEFHAVEDFKLHWGLPSKGLDKASWMGPSPCWVGDLKWSWMSSERDPLSCHYLHPGMGWDKLMARVQKNHFLMVMDQCFRCKVPVVLFRDRFTGFSVFRFPGVASNVPSCSFSTMLFIIRIQDVAAPK